MGKEKHNAIEEYSFCMPRGSRLGMVLALYHESDRCFVEEVYEMIDGSPNPLAGRVQEGDELVSVAGCKVQDAGTWAKLRALLGRDALDSNEGIRLTFAAGPKSQSV